MIFSSKKGIIVYKQITIDDIPSPIMIVKDPIDGGYTVYLTKYPGVIAEGNTLSDAIDSIKRVYLTMKKFELKRN